MTLHCSRLVDMTLTLMGQTIYIESLYYPGWWVGTSEGHNGALFQLSEVTSANINLTITIECH